MRSSLFLYFSFFSFFLFCSQAFGQKTKAKDEDLIFRFDLQLEPGNYLFYEGPYFPKPNDASHRPEKFIPDEYFSTKATSLKIGKTKTRYGAYILTAQSDYVFTKINGKNGWLKTTVPVTEPKKQLLRRQFNQDLNKRHSETNHKLGINYSYFHITPFQDPDFVLVDQDGFDYILDLKNQKSTWQAGSYYEGAEINFKTNYLECYGDMMGGRYVFDQYGKRIEERLSKEELDQIDQLIQKEYDVKPGSKQAAFLKRYMVAMVTNDGKALTAIMDSVQRLGVPLASLLPKPKVKSLTTAQLMSKAVEHNNFNRIDSILQTGFPIDSIIIYKEGKPTHQFVPILSAATSENNIPLMKHLLAKGANLNKGDRNKKTAVCYVKSSEALNMLLLHGASLDKIDYWEHKKLNIYPTEYLYSNQELIPIIIEKAPAHLFKDFDFYERMLQSFIRNNDTVGIRSLLNRGITLIKPDKGEVASSATEYYQPLYYAQTKEMFKFLINNGARLTNLDSYGHDAHLKAFGWADKDLVEWLEAKGLPIQKPNNPYFVFQKDPAFITYLLKRGVSVNSIDNHGNTALIRAKHFETNPELEKFLLDHGADKNIVNKRGGSYHIGRTGPW